MAQIQYKDIGKRFGSVAALQDLNLTVEDHEFVTLVGPSGCGKSTTLNITAGLEDPSQGELYIDGEMVNAFPPGQRDIAMVFQSYALYPHKTVRDNIGFGLKVRKMERAEIDKRVQEAAELLGITELLERKPRALSGGQRQRVALGRAITRDPKVFLLDEPLSNLDAKLRVQMRAELKLLFDRIQGTVLYVTHDQAEAMTMSDRVVVMHQGFVQQVGTPLEVYDSPVNEFVAGFMGSPPMNFIPCHLTQEDDQLIASREGMQWQTSLAGESQSATRFVANRQQLSGQSVLGIRPEDIIITPVDAADQNQTSAGISGQIRFVEHMGAMNVYHLEVGNQRIIATTDAKIFFPQGMHTNLRLDSNKLHFFDEGSGANITLTDN